VPPSKDWWAATLPGSQLGVLVEVNLRSDFVARTGEFPATGHDIAMQIAAATPASSAKRTSRPEVPRRTRDPARPALAEGKPRKIVDRSSKAA